MALLVVSGSPSRADIISELFYFNVSDTGLTNGPWASITISQDTNNPYRVSFIVDPFENRFNIPDINLFGVERFLTNFNQGTRDTSLLTIQNLSTIWYWSYSPTGINSHGFGNFDVKLRETGGGLYLQNPLAFDFGVINNAYMISISDFTTQLSTEGYIFSGVISGFHDYSPNNNLATRGGFAAVPEPGGMIILGLGLVGLGMVGRRKRTA